MDRAVELIQELSREVGSDEEIDLLYFAVAQLRSLGAMPRCSECDGVIDMGLCSYECPLDAQHNRPEFGLRDDYAHDDVEDNWEYRHWHSDI